MTQVYERRRTKSNQIYQNLLELLDQVFKSTINSGAPRAQRASEAPWVREYSKYMHAKNFGKVMTSHMSDRTYVRPSV